MYQERRDPSQKKKGENNDENGVNLMKQNNMKNPQIVKYPNCYPEIFQPDFFLMSCSRALERERHCVNDLHLSKVLSFLQFA